MSIFLYQFKVIATFACCFASLEAASPISIIQYSDAAFCTELLILPRAFTTKSAELEVLIEANECSLQGFATVLHEGKLRIITNIFYFSN